MFWLGLFVGIVLGIGGTFLTFYVLAVRDDANTEED